jgi:uncharacterized protein YydD (DUF2326 family)
MLVRLYSETGLLVEPITFQPGINIIYGKYSKEADAKGINGIGKSSLVRLINYMLLSDSSEKEFKKAKYNFFRTEQHSLILEFSVNGKKQFIKREFENEDIIWYGTMPNKLTDYDKTELLNVLSGLLLPVESNEVYLEGNKFRTLMQFFIKDDIQNKGRSDATNFFSFTPNAVEKNIYNFYLLNLPTKNMINFNEVAKDYKTYSSALKTHEEKLKIETGRTIEEYRSEKLKLETNVATLRSRLTSYDFKDTHAEIEKKLSEIIAQINSNSQEYHLIGQKLKNIRDSYQVNQDIDTEKIKKLYNEVQANFGTSVKKSLDEIIEFKKEILENRNKFLVKKEKDLIEVMNAVFEELSKLENSRTKLLSELKEKGVLDKLEKTYENLLTEQGSLERQNLILQQVDEYNVILSNLEVALSGTKKDVVADIQRSHSSLDELRKLFYEILEATVYMDGEPVSGYFDVAVNAKSKKGMLPFKIDVSIPKSGSHGQEVLKTIAYDLMIFLNAVKQKRNFPDFLIHDGVFYGMSHKTMVNILNYIHKKSAELNDEKQFQYIVTFSEDEVEVPTDKKDLYGEFSFNFDKKKIIVLEDIETKMLFKRDIRQ